MAKPDRPSSQSWRTFLANHAKDIVSIDFFTVPTVTFGVIYMFLVLDNARRTVRHFNVTCSPSATWTGQQMVAACFDLEAPRYLFRDRDGKFGERFTRRVDSLGIEQILTSYRSPWQNPYVERVIGSIRRECLDHVIILNERHLRRVLRDTPPPSEAPFCGPVCSQGADRLPGALLADLLNLYEPVATNSQTALTHFAAKGQSDRFWKGTAQMGVRFESFLYLLDDASRQEG